MRTFLAATSSLALLAAPSAFAAEQTVKSSIGDFSCAGRAYMVEQTRTEVEGVQTVEVSARRKDAMVTFDDTKTNVPALATATAGTGFPSTLIE